MYIYIVIDVCSMHLSLYIGLMKDPGLISSDLASEKKQFLRRTIKT